MSNSSIDNKLNEINDRNRQNPQNEPDEEENMSGFEKGRLAALNAKYAVSYTHLTLPTNSRV